MTLCGVEFTSVWTLWTKPIVSPLLSSPSEGLNQHHKLLLKLSQRYYVSQEYYFSCTSVILASRLDLQETSAEPPHEARGPVCRLYICGIRTINWNSINNWEKCRRSFPFSCMDENMQPHAGLPDERKEKQHEQEEEEVEKPIWWRKLNNVKDETAEGNPWEKSVTSVLWVLKKNVKVEQTFFFFEMKWKFIWIL